MDTALSIVDPWPYILLRVTSEARVRRNLKGFLPRSSPSPALLSRIKDHVFLTVVIHTHSMELERFSGVGRGTACGGRNDRSGSKQ